MRSNAPHALVIFVALSALAGCGDDTTAADETAPADTESSAPRRAPPEPIYGPDGELLESTSVVAGLRLPRGLEVAIEDERRHVYHTDAPLIKVQRYFGTRLITGEVDRLGSGSVYRNAVPSHVRGAPVHMDVSILPRGRRGVRVEVRERPSYRQVNRTEEEVRRQLEEDRRRLD